MKFRRRRERSQAGKAIRDIYEKKLALENLAKIIKPDENPEMYHRLIADYGSTMHDFEDWWNGIFRKYEVEAGNYNVDFRSNQIFRTVQD